MSSSKYRDRSPVRGAKHSRDRRRSRSSDERRRSRSRSHDKYSDRQRHRERKTDHGHEDRLHHRIKKERISPDRHENRNRNGADDTHDDRLHRRIKKEKFSPVRNDSRDRHRRHSPDVYQEERRRNDERRINNARKRRRKEEEVDDSQFTFGKPEIKEEPGENEKDKPDFGLSGKLTEDTNTYKGVVIKYNEPPEARKPKVKWRLYPFKGEEALPVLHVHRQSGYLIGRDRKVVDVPIDHPSCSKQHAVLQYRSVEYQREDGRKGRRTRPYIIDLGSANGTFVNNVKIESERYYELFEKDTVKFGFSSRDYVLLHDGVDTSELDDLSD